MKINRYPLWSVGRWIKILWVLLRTEIKKQFIDIKGVIFNYPFPNRKLSKSEDSSKNIGFAQGLFNDGRPFHAECWAEDGATHWTFFFSAIGLETSKKDELIDFLTREGVIKLIEGRPCYCRAGIFQDDSNHKMLSATITIGDENCLFVLSKMPLHRWNEFVE